MKAAISTRVGLTEDSASESDYDFVSDPENTPPSSPRAGAAAGAAGESPGGSGSAIAAEPAVVVVGPSAVGEIAGLISTVAPGGGSGTTKAPLFKCAVCAGLLRDCVECPRCHSLFCRKHLTVNKYGRSPCAYKPCCSTSTDDSNINNNPTGAGSSRKSKSRITSVLSNNTMPPNVNDSNATAAAAAASSLPEEAFQPNIPVQRMADAVPSVCKACNLSLTWGELGSHTCDLQIVPCPEARWGCTWTGRRVQLASHSAGKGSSTCPGRIARVENKLSEVRAELSASRGEVLAAREACRAMERRALEAEIKVSKMEEACSARLREREEEKARADAAVAALEKANADIDKLKKATISSARVAFRGAPDNKASGTTAAPTASTQEQQQQQQHGLGAITAMFTGSVSSTEAVTNRDSNSSASGTAGSQQQLPSSPSRRQRSTASAASTTSRMPQAAVEAACQAPVPATEACLRPYLERPDSLLEKKVVVFWPR
ncbi:unnamed protein product [Sphacelaria rigidula]